MNPALANIFKKSDKYLPEAFFWFDPGCAKESAGGQYSIYHLLKPTGLGLNLSVLPTPTIVSCCLLKFSFLESGDFGKEELRFSTKCLSCLQGCSEELENMVQVYFKDPQFCILTKSKLEAYLTSWWKTELGFY